MTGQLRAAGALAAATCALLVLGVPLMILLVLDPSAQAACGGTPTGPGPSSVPGIPPNLLPIFEGAAQQFELGSDGWAYLAAFNYAESEFGADNGPGTGVLSGSNSAGAAGPMQIGIGGAATDNWDTIVAEIPTELPGGAQPPSVYNEVDAVYGAAALLQEVGGAAELAGGARGVEQLPARDRAGHPARRAVHPNRPREQRRARGRDVDRARTARRPGVCPGQRADDPRRGRHDPAQRAGGDPAGRAARGAGDDRRR